MKNNFDHIILTPFNLHAPKWRQGRHPAHLDDIWMEMRMQIFADVTVPSMMAQTNQDFKWIVVFDRETPDKWVTKILSTKGRCHVAFTKQSKTMWVDLINCFRSKIHLITTRLDCDDALHENFIDNVQHKFNGLNSGFLNFAHGIVTDGIKAYKSYHLSNSFTSRIGLNSDEHIRTMKHRDVKQQQGFIQDKETEPMWLIYVHGKNVGNKITDTSKPVEPDALKGFNIHLPITKELNRR